MTKNPLTLSDAHLTFLRYQVQRMYNRGEFDLLNLRRSITKHCKTFCIGNRFGLKLKKSEYGLFCYIIETVDGITEIKVNSYKHPDKDFKFHVKNNREFMLKLLKHDLL